MLERRHLALGLALLALYLVSCKGQSSADLCVSAQGSCEECIRAHPDCFWCTDPPAPNKTMTVVHCYNISDDNVPFCTNTVENPMSTIENVKNVELSTESLPGVESIQFRPQIVSMDLRPGDPQSFNMSFIALRNTPLDVYFLLDVSASLASTITSLRVNLGEIAASIQNVSSAFRIGIGGFIDKDVFPYAGLTSYNTMPLGATEPQCPQTGGVCDPPFGFRHWQELTDNISQFQEVLNTSAAQLRVNVDFPEGGLDALMQVAVCTDIIGWREGALRMVFLITDTNYHIAGDGYLAGLVRPNDGLCHLEPFNGTSEYDYTFSDRQDYPSIHQLLAALERNLIVPIFSIQQSVANDQNIVPYQTLANEMRRIQAQALPIERTGVDESVTAETIIELINEAYENTSQTIQILPVEIPGYSVTTELLNCPQPTDEAGACRVSFDDVIVYRVTVELTDCSLATNTTIGLQGAQYVFSDIMVNPLCDCGCSADENAVPNSALCNNGTLQCGQCNCIGGRQGDLCECDSDDDLTCPTGVQGLECSGVARGVCSTCGDCECIPPNFGDACECDDTTCPTNCNGRGRCDCSTSRCNCTATASASGALYFGDQCECDPDMCWNSNFNTRQSETQELCHSPTAPDSPGMCACSGCECSAQNLVPFGGLCLPNDICGFFAPCVSCFLASPGRNILEECDTACRTHPQFRFLMGNEEPAEEYLNAACEATFGGCIYNFFVGEDDPYSVAVLVDPMMDCPSPLPTWAPYVIAAGIVLAIILLGLLILCLLKICFVIWDKREYRKFTQELQTGDFDQHQNPLYLTPQQEYQNPLRRNSKKRK